MTTDELIDKIVKRTGSERSAIAWLMGYAERLEVDQNRVRTAVGAELLDPFLEKLENQTL